MAAQVFAFAPRPPTDVRSPLQSGAVAAFPAWRTNLKGWVDEEAVNMGPLLAVHSTARAILLRHEGYGCEVWCPLTSVRRDPATPDIWVMPWLAKRFHPPRRW